MHLIVTVFSEYLHIYREDRLVVRLIRIPAGREGTFHLHFISIADDGHHLFLCQRTEPKLLQCQRIDRVYQRSIQIKDQTLIFHICLHIKQKRIKNCATHFITLKKK